MRNNNYSAAVIISLILHALLLVALLWGTDFSMDKPKQSGNTIQAVVVDPALVNQQAQRIRQERENAKKAEQDRLRRLEQQAAQLEKQRQAEEKRLRELKANKLKAEKEAREAEKERQRVAAERKKAAEEKRKADEAAKVAKAQAAKAEAERKAKQEAARKAEQERQRKLAEQRKAEEAARKAEEARKAKEAERKRAEAAAKKAEQARKEAERKAAEARELQRQQEAALNDMFAGLEAETEQRGGARGQFIADEAKRYGSIYKQMIQQNLLVDQSFFGKECVIRMRLSANGLLLDASEDGGDATLCRAAKAAVVKVSQFPMPEDPAVVEKLRSIRLTVSPE
ncbi:protein TolA [Photobacterium jeanii]|uniref:Protein TolA n=1 Tax=Photobacterium jeanii TaxID=858640 RepID=A0A178KMC5_9GAMM|nr:cell envelope integrity protein TolA [Photobacterium jeanii]OAN18427.1 protein TolA [Photobacterium jeanii]PST91892.1 cell envelope integrity protein TolA [Photobacterium jeanii]